MGAEGVPNCQRPRAPGGTRTLVTAIRVRRPRRWTTSAIIQVGPEGLEPTPAGLKVRNAADYTTTLLGRAYAFQPGQLGIMASFLCLILASGSPENRTQRHVVISRVWATSPRLPNSSVGDGRTRTCVSVAKARGFAVPHIPSVPRTLHANDAWGRRTLTQWVGRCSNPRPLVFSEVLLRLSYRPNDKNKKPDVVVTPGFRYSSESTAKRHKRKG